MSRLYYAMNALFQFKNDNMEYNIERDTEKKEKRSKLEMLNFMFMSESKGTNMSNGIYGGYSADSRMRVISTMDSFYKKQQDE